MTLQSVTICNLVVDFESVISKSRGGGGGNKHASFMLLKDNHQSRMVVLSEIE